MPQTQPMDIFRDNYFILFVFLDNSGVKATYGLVQKFLLIFFVVINPKYLKSKN